MVLLTLLSAFVTLVVALLLLRHGRGHARRYGDAKPQRFHVGDVPRLGGLAMFAGTCGGWLAGVLVQQTGNNANLHITAMAALVCVGVVLPSLAGGVAEDLTQRLSVRYRLLLTGISAALALYWLDPQLPRLGFASIDGWWAAMPWLGGVVAFVAIMGLPHAFNIIDGYNGLAGMVALVVCLALAHVALQVGDRQLAALVLCLAGATAGFLVWNYPRGLLFAGDGGAYLWGVVIAVASLTLVARHREVSPWFPFLLLSYPIWETFFSIYRKLARGVSPSVADALHFHQLIYRRLVRGVFSDDESRRILMRNNRTSPYLWGFTLLTVAPAVLFWRNTWVLLGFCVVFALSYITAYLAIVRFKVPNWLRY